VRPSLSCQPLFAELTGCARSSIVFLALYALLAPLALWRLAVKETRHVVLVRPLVVLVARLATYAIRTAEVTGHESEGLLIAEQVGPSTSSPMIRCLSDGLLTSNSTRRSSSTSA